MLVYWRETLLHIFGLFIYARLWVVNFLKYAFWCFYFPILKKINKKEKKIKNKKSNEKKEEKKAKSKKRKKTNKRQIQLISFGCGKYFIVKGLECCSSSCFIWSIVGCSVVFLAISSTNFQNICPPFSVPLSPHYNPWKELLTVMCTLHFSGRELKNLGKLMVVCFIRLSPEWTYAIFQTHEWEWSTFP